MKEVVEYKRKKKEKTAMISCKVRKEQHEFLLMNNINVSEVIRDVIGDLMDASNTRRTKHE